MLRYVARRLAYLVPVWLGISILAFALSLLARLPHFVLKQQTGYDRSQRSGNFIWETRDVDDANVPLVFSLASDRSYELSDDLREVRVIILVFLHHELKARV